MSWYHVEKAFNSGLRFLVGGPRNIYLPGNVVSAMGRNSRLQPQDYIEPSRNGQLSHNVVLQWIGAALNLIEHNQELVEPSLDRRTSCQRCVRGRVCQWERPSSKPLVWWTRLNSVVFQCSVHARLHVLRERPMNADGQFRLVLLWKDAGLRHQSGSRTTAWIVFPGITYLGLPCLQQRNFLSGE